MYKYRNWRDLYGLQLITHFAQSYLYLCFKFVCLSKKKKAIKKYFREIIIYFQVKIDVFNLMLISMPMCHYVNCQIMLGCIILFCAKFFVNIS